MTTLAWTLVHFLWQGAIIALAAWLAMRARPDASARYLTGVVALTALMAAPLVTLAILSRDGAGTPANLVAASVLPQGTGAETALVSSGPSNAASSAAAARPSAIDAASPYLLIVWFAGVMSLSVRLAIRWWLARRLTHRGRAMAAADLQAMATRLAGRLALDRVVRLLQSTDVSVPVVVGWLRPVVILPTAAIAALPPAHLEALLAHELAHVRRHDYLVNLMQSVVETVLFYHPAVWWVSREVRIAREQCCDDLAVGVCDRLEYVTALTNLAALATHPQIALAATDGSLVARVRRLLGDTSADHGQTTGWVAAIAGVLIVGAVPAGLALTPRQTPAPAPPATPREIARPVEVETPREVAIPIEVSQAKTPTTADLVEIRKDATRAPIEVRQSQVSAEAEARMKKQSAEAEQELKALERELLALSAKQADLERSKIAQDFDDQIKTLRQRFELESSELQRLKRQVEVGLAPPSQTKELEVQLAELERKLASTVKDKEYRITDFELQLEQQKKMKEYDQLRAKLEERQKESARLLDKIAEEAGQNDRELRAAAELRLEGERKMKVAETGPLTLSISVAGLSSLELAPAPQPYVSGGPAVYLHLDAARSTAKAADGRVISGFKFISWREGDRYRVMVLAMVPRIGEKNAFTTDAKLSEFVDFATYLVSPGLDITLEKLSTAGKGPITLRVK